MGLLQIGSEPSKQYISLRVKPVKLYLDITKEFDDAGIDHVTQQRELFSFYIEFKQFELSPMTSWRKIIKMGEMGLF